MKDCLQRLFDKMVFLFDVKDLSFGGRLPAPWIPKREMHRKGGGCLMVEIIISVLTLLVTAAAFVFQIYVWKEICKKENRLR
jgi:hypothetical protein